MTTIPGVPASITRRQYITLIESIGLDPYQLVEVVFGRNAITTVVIAKDADGKPYPDPGEPNALAKHVITIPVVDEP